MCSSFRPKSVINERCASSRKVPSWANTVRTGSAEDRATCNFDSVVGPTCCSACGLRWYGGRYLGKQGARLAYGAFGRVLWIAGPIDKYNVVFTNEGGELLIKFPLSGCVKVNMILLSVL